MRDFPRMLISFKLHLQTNNYFWSFEKFCTFFLSRNWILPLAKFYQAKKSQLHIFSEFRKLSHMTSHVIIFIFATYPLILSILPCRQASSWLVDLYFIIVKALTNSLFNPCKRQQNSAQYASCLLWKVSHLHSTTGPKPTSVPRQLVCHKRSIRHPTSALELETAPEPTNTLLRHQINSYIEQVWDYSITFRITTIDCSIPEISTCTMVICMWNTTIFFSSARTILMLLAPRDISAYYLQRAFWKITFLINGSSIKPKLNPLFYNKLKAFLRKSLRKSNTFIALI